MSTQMRGLAPATRVMSRNEPPIAVSGSWPSMRASPACTTSRFASTCGRWLVTASRRSCTPASIATGVAPSAASRRCRSRRRAGSVSASGVRYQVAPSNSSARAFCAPRVSMPAIGWPPMKRGRSSGRHRCDDAGLGRADVGDRRLRRQGLELRQHGGQLGHGRAQDHELGARDGRRQVVGDLVHAAARHGRLERARVGIEAHDASDARALARREAERAAHQSEPDDRETLDHSDRASPRINSARRKARSSDWRAFRRGSQSDM